MQVIFAPAVANRMVGINLHQTLFVHFDGGEFEIEPTAQKLLITRPVL